MTTALIVGLVLVAIVGWWMLVASWAAFARFFEKELLKWVTLHKWDTEAFESMRLSCESYKMLLDKEREQTKRTYRLIAMLTCTYGPFAFDRKTSAQFDGDFVIDTSSEERITITAKGGPIPATYAPEWTVTDAGH